MKEADITSLQIKAFPIDAYSVTLPFPFHACMCLGLKQCSQITCMCISVSNQLTWTAKALYADYGNIKYGAEHFVSYLPLSHIAGQVYNSSCLPTLQKRDGYFNTKCG